MALVIIPAYQPDRRLLEVLQGLAASSCLVLLIDDGSGARYRALFDEASQMKHVSVLRHAANLGKGAALRTGFNHALCNTREPIVTADADGQHTPEDILSIAAVAHEAPEHLVLGARAIGNSAPARSRFGNRLTCMVFRLIHGLALQDTQTGLRGVPRRLAEAMLTTTATGYELETDMLIAARRLDVPMREVPVPGRYLDGNAASHFNPLLDSMRIYFVLLRFGAASLATAVVDNLAFFAALSLGTAPSLAQFLARAAAVALYFSLNRNMVFLSARRDGGVLGRYLGVVAVSGWVSYLSLMTLHATFGIPLVGAKLLAETAIFFANFVLLRDFVFRPSKPKATDWTSYYNRVPWTARLTRRYTGKAIIEAFQRAQLKPGPVVLELGGANSCFLETVERAANPSIYHVLDSNRFGLDQLAGRNVVVHEADVLTPRSNENADFVFSIGLIEHFDPEGTARAVEAHFDQARPGAGVLISFPAPTLLYRITRGAIETVGQWRFHDERPLRRKEVLAAVGQRGELLWEKTLWPLILTQHMMLFRALPLKETANQAQRSTFRALP